MYMFLTFVSMLVFTTKQALRGVEGSNSTLKHNKFSYSVYQPGWSLINDGALQVWFRTGMKNAMVIYEEDGGQGEFLDVFLVEGKIRMRMTIGDCNYEERVVNGSFSDFKWHKLVIRKKEKNTTLSIDNSEASPFQCSSQVGPMTALYTGYLSIYVKDPTQGWVFPSSQWDSMRSMFQGCIRDIQYTEGSVVTIPQLRSTKLTEPGCSSLCLKLKCRHGGSCVDHILTAWCDCEGTGYQGKHCARALPRTSTSSSISTTTSTLSVIKLNSVSPSQKEPGKEKSLRKGTGAYHTAVIWTAIASTALSFATIVFCTF